MFESLPDGLQTGVSPAGSGRRFVLMPPKIYHQYRHFALSIMVVCVLNRTKQKIVEEERVSLKCRQSVEIRRLGDFILVFASPPNFILVTILRRSLFSKSEIDRVYHNGFSHGRNEIM